LIRAKIAILADHYHLSLDQIANLTDRSIAEVYFHARTKEGSIQIPVPVMTAAQEEQTEAETEESALRDLSFLRGANLISEENYAVCVAEIKRKYRGS
jgi:hypothetical protein